MILPPPVIRDPPPPVPGDEDPPVISTFEVSPSVFKAATRGASTATAVGTSVRYRLSEPAVVTLRAERCTKRRGRRCTRYARVPGAIVRASVNGLNRLGFSGRLRGKLKAGRYRLVATAADTAGNVSPRESVDFRVVKR